MPPKKMLIKLFIGLFSCSLLLSVLPVYILNPNPSKHEYNVPFKDNSSQSIAYTVWEPAGSGLIKDKVIFLYHGFSAQQPMMYPLMRELTKRNYFVITIDMRGHGQSGGLYDANLEILLQDFDTVKSDVQTRYPILDWSNVGVVGHSMGGYLATYIGNQRDDVLVTVGIAPASFDANVNQTNPKNFLAIIGDQDQVFTTTDLLNDFQNSQPGAEFGLLYKNNQTGFYRKVVVAENARHEDELAADTVLSEVVSFIELSFGYISNTENIQTHQSIYIIIVYIGFFFGLISLGILLLFFVDTREEKNPEIDALQSNNQTVSDQNTKIQKIPPREFFKKWFFFYGCAIVPAGLIFLVGLLIAPAGFASMIILLEGIYGFAALLGIRYYGKKTDGSLKLRDHLKSYWKQTRKNLSKRTLSSAIFVIGLGIFMMWFGFGKTYLILFPLNLRSLYLLLYIPIFFILGAFQHWFFFDFLAPRLQNPSQILWTPLIANFAILYVLGLIGNIAGIAIFSMIFLFTIFDLVSILFGSWAYLSKHNHEIILVWKAIFIPIVYLGFAVFMKLSFNHPG